MPKPTPPSPTAAAGLSAPLHEMSAPSAWHTVDFISDVHLHESQPASFLAWRQYLQSTPADAVFILGDLFEVWVGDDVLGQDPHSNLLARHEGLAFEDRCRRVLHHSAQSKALYFMHGNRDFLLGPAMLKACGMQGLPDPTVLVFGQQRFLLSHGDALCTGDVEYQAFRAQVRNAAWQSEFFARPLAERQRMAREMRAHSEARKQQGEPWVDLDAAHTRNWMDAAQAQHMIHGHTHEGVDHPLHSNQGAGVRHVLWDWHAEATPARAQVLRLSLHKNSPVVQRLNVS